MRLTHLAVAACLLTAVPAFAAGELLITEIMYNSAETTDVEWFEVYNAGSAELDLTGWWVIDDNASHTPIPLSGTLAPSSLMVMAGTEALFTAKYPGVTNLFPACFQTYGVEWSLGNSGDQLNIYDAANTLVDSVLFDDAAPWPTTPDGSGPSLLLIGDGCADHSSGACWTAGQNDGTPGVLTGTVANASTAWGELKVLYR